MGLRKQVATVTANIAGIDVSSSLIDSLRILSPADGAAIGNITVTGQNPFRSRPGTIVGGSWTSGLE